MTLAVSCTSKDDKQSGEVVVTDAIGRNVSVNCGTYKRVVCVGAGALRMYCYVGDVGLLCGVEDIDNTTLEQRPKMFDSVARPYVLAYGDAFATLPSCGAGGPNAQTAEAEKILSCAPDVVISEYEDVEKENALQSQLGVPVLTVKFGKDGVWSNDFLQSLQLLGLVFGKSQRATELCDFITAERQAISDKTSQIDQTARKNVYVCGLGNWGTTDYLTTSQNYAPFEIAHIKNAVSGLAANGPQKIEEEKLVAIGENIDVIVLDAAAVKNIAPLYEKDPTMLDFVKAWREGEIYLEMAYNAYYTNAEIALANTWYAAKVVYPELFADVDMTAKTAEITQVFLGKDLANAIFACPSSFGGYQKIDPATFFAN